MKRCHPTTTLGDESRRDKPSPQERSRMACDQCRKRKLKCDDQRPCETCRTRDLPCTISSTRKGPGRPRTHGDRGSSNAISPWQTLEDSPQPASTTLLGTTSSASHPASTVLDVGNASPGTPELNRMACNLSPAITPAPRFDVQTVSDAAAFPLSAFEDTFPSLSEIGRDEQDTLEWNPHDIDLLSGFWDPPTSVYLHFISTVFLAYLIIGDGNLVLRCGPL